MSITFWMPQAPEERVQPYPDEPDYWEVRPVAPFMEINMTAGNANAILELIAPQWVNINEDPHGTWDHNTLAGVRSATIRALNSEIRDRAISATTRETGGRGAMVIHYGRDVTYVVQRLENFLALTKVAMEHDFDVVFG